MRYSLLAFVLASLAPIPHVRAAVPLPQAQGARAASTRIEVIPLEFAKATDAAKHLNRTMRLGRRSEFVVVPHAERNALLLRGPVREMEKAKNLIVAFDVLPALQHRDASTEVVAVQHGKANEIADTLNRFLRTADGNDLRIEAHAPNNLLLVRGATARVQQCLALVAKLDREPAAASVAPRFVKLAHTKAAEVAATVNRFLGLDQQAGPNRGLFVDANRQHNAVILRGTRQQIQPVLDLIARIDVPAAGSKGIQNRTLVLKHTRAKEVAATLRELARELPDQELVVRYSEKDNALVLQGREDRMKNILALVQHLETKAVAAPKPAQSGKQRK